MHEFLEVVVDVLLELSYRLCRECVRYSFSLARVFRTIPGVE